jgi:hypothetical protein
MKIPIGIKSLYSFQAVQTDNLLSKILEIFGAITKNAFIAFIAPDFF